MTRKILVRAVCEAIEPRRYLSVSFGTPNKLSIAGIRAPLGEVFLTGNNNPADLAVAIPNTVQILIGEDDGTFVFGNSIALPSNSTSGKPFLVGTFNGGSDDIVLLSATTVMQEGGFQYGVITYETNNGSGGFTAGGMSLITNNNQGFVPITAAVGDFNGDGNTDIAVIGTTLLDNQLVLAIMTSNGNGSFTETGDYDIAGSNSLGSLSNELILSGPLTNGNAGCLIEDGSSGSGQLVVFTGDGSGALTQLSPVALNATLITAGRFTSSATADLVTADGDTITTLLGNGDGTFTALPPATLGGTINALSGADFDEDGNRDIVTNLGAQLGNGDGTFQSPTPLPGLGSGAVFANALVAGNIDDDGRPDIVGFSSAGGTIASALNTTKAFDSVTVASNDNPASPGDNVQFSATISTNFGGTPTGTVEFFEGTTDLGGAPLIDSSATFDAGTGLTIGSHSITAQYSGDSTFAASTSNALAQVVLAPTTITMTSDENPSSLGDDVTFTATVAGNDGSGDVPTGDVDFFDNTVAIGSGSLDENGQAIFDTASLSATTHQITAEYQGDGNFSPSTTTFALSQSVIEPALVPTVASTTLPATIVGGTAAHAKAVVNLTNETGSLITGPAVVTIFASTNGAVSDTTPSIVSLTVRNLKIQPSATMPITLQINVPSVSLPAGSYTLIAQVSYNSGTITNATSGPALTVAAPFIALSPVLTFRQLPTAIVSGSATHAVATVRLTNHGNVSSIGPVTIAFSASATQNVPGTPIISVTKNFSIKPNASAMVTVPLKAIPALATGNYFIVLQTTDPDHNTAVVSSATSVTAAAPFVSLSSSISSVKPTSVARKKSVSFVVTITNNGNINASGPTTFDLGISSDGQTIASQLIDLTRTVALAPGVTKAVVLTFKIPSTATSGSFFPAVSISQNGNTASAIGLSEFAIV
jgi:Bacterial Ig-like domain (group 3)